MSKNPTHDDITACALELILHSHYVEGIDPLAFANNVAAGANLLKVVSQHEILSVLLPVARRGFLSADTIEDAMRVLSKQVSEMHACVHNASDTVYAAIQATTEGRTKH